MFENHWLATSRSLQARKIDYWSGRSVLHLGIPPLETKERRLNELPNLTFARQFISALIGIMGVISSQGALPRASTSVPFGDWYDEIDDPSKRKWKVILSINPNADAPQPCSSATVNDDGWRACRVDRSNCHQFAWRLVRKKMTPQAETLILPHHPTGFHAWIIPRKW